MKNLILLALAVTLTGISCQISAASLQITAANCPSAQLLKQYQSYVYSMSNPGFPGLSSDFKTNQALFNQAHQELVSSQANASILPQFITYYIYAYAMYLYLSWSLANNQYFYDAVKMQQLDPVATLNKKNNALSFLTTGVIDPVTYTREPNSPIQYMDACAKVVLG